MSKLYDSYRAIKKLHPEGILLIQIGDFYEAFGEDANQLADAAEYTRTKRTIDGVSVSLCGFPVFTLSQVVRKLNSKNITVVVAEPSEPKAAQGYDIEVVRTGSSLVE